MRNAKVVAVFVTPVSVLFSLAVVPQVNAQSYPAKLVRVIAPFAPGGGTDFIARVTARKLSEAFGQQFVVDNRPGAGGTLGAEIGAKAPADGYTLTMISGSYAVNPSLYKLAFDPVADITPVIQLSQGPAVVMVHPSLPVKTIKELVALAKARPGDLLYATSGQGSLAHLSTALFCDVAGINMTHVPYKGTGPALVDTLAGQTQVIFGSVAVSVQHAKSGRLRPIAVSTAKRIEALPNVPTVLESGINYETIIWHGLIGPKNLPGAIVGRINAEVNKLLLAKDMQEKLAGDGVSPAGGTPEQFTNLIKRDVQTWQRIVKKMGIKL
jgi:tripartite-type tricarboxylate transporter receptor subunit TctC